MFEQGGGEILSALFFVGLFESCKFHYLPQMATHALRHMIYGYTLLVTMHIYNFNFSSEFTEIFLISILGWDI